MPRPSANSRRFEDDPEGGPGHEVVVADASYRIMTLDHVSVAFIPPTR
jgi:hypothetical protein